MILRIGTGAGMAALVVYSALGLLLGLFLLGFGGWGSAIGTGMTLGSLAVGAGAWITVRRPERGGVIVVLGAIASSASFGIFAGLWGSTDWQVILEVVVACVVLLGGVPILIGLSFYMAATWPRKRLGD